MVYLHRPTHKFPAKRGLEIDWHYSVSASQESVTQGRSATVLKLVTIRANNDVIYESKTRNLRGLRDSVCVSYLPMKQCGPTASQQCFLLSKDVLGL